MKENTYIIKDNSIEIMKNGKKHVQWCRDSNDNSKCGFWCPSCFIANGTLVTCGGEYKKAEKE